MNMLETEFLEYLNNLPLAEKEQLALKWLGEVRQSESDTMLSENSANNTTCPHCHSDKIQKNGKSHNTQNFKCKGCCKTFTTKTKTIFANTNKSTELWCRYIDLMGKKLSLRHIAKELDINLKTAFM